MTQKQYTPWFVVFAVVVFLMQVFPLYAIGNRVEPIVLGMPFSMFWIALWIFIQFIGLLIFYQISKSARP